MITKAGVPSFVVTLAGLLIWSGVVLILTTQYSTAGTIRIQNDTVVGIANDFLSDIWGWMLGGVVVVAVRRSRSSGKGSRAHGRGLHGEAGPGDRASESPGSPRSSSRAVWYANQDRGVPR